MLVEIEISTNKKHRLEVPAVVGTFDSHEKPWPLQWPTKGYRDITGWQYRNIDKCLNLRIYKLFEVSNFQSH